MHTVFKTFVSSNINPTKPDISVTICYKVTVYIPCQKAKTSAKVFV